MVAFYFFKEPWLKKPPAFDLPDSTADPSFYGEIWIRYPLDRTKYPKYFGHTFMASIQLRVILNELAAELFTAGQTKKFLSLEEAYAFEFKCKSWFEALPAVISAASVVLPNQLKVQ